MNVFIGGEEISKLAVYSSEKYHSSQSAAYLRIYQNFSLKTAPLKNLFSKLLPQKIFFPNCSLKKYISKFFWKNGSFKNYIFKIFSLKNCSFKKYIFKIAFLNKINLIALIYSLLESSDSSEKEKSLKL